MTPLNFFSSGALLGKRTISSLFLLLVCSAYCAEDAGPPGLNEKVSEALQQKMKPQLDAKNWDGALAAVDAILATVDSESYDNAFVSDIKAKIFLQKNDLVKAISPMETTLRLADKHRNYFDKKTVLDLLYLLAQIYYQEGSVTKTAATQREYFNKSANYIKRWIETSPKKSAEATLFYASILYNQAVSNPDKVDMSLVSQSKKEVQEGLLSTLKPKDGFYMLWLAALQQEGDFLGSAEVLELLVKQKPDNKVYWQQLMATYLNLGGSTEKNESKVREYYARAINTLERAQSAGLLKDQKDNYNLVTMYYNSGQFGRSTDLLYEGLKNGSIDSDVKNWQLLAYSYQQVGQHLTAISVLKEAAVKFPKTGQLDLQIGQIYSQLDNKTSEAYSYYKSAVGKEGLDKPHSAYMSLAYTAFELEKFDEALEAITKASTYPESKKDTLLPRLKTAIEEAIKDQIANKSSAVSKP